MADTKMLQAILDNQARIENKIDGLKVEIKGVEKRLTERLDKQGKQLAVLDDDAPTMMDHKFLERRIRNLELKVEELESQRSD